MIERICAIRGTPFFVTEAEEDIYRRLEVPLPQRCPEERAKARLAWRNERILYRRPCDATGRQIVSIFDSGTSFPVYSQEYWWSDAWDPLNYGRELDFSRSFFEQWAELFDAVPQCALRCPQSENSEYTNQCEKNKDCYLVFCSNGSRECLHGMWFQQCIESTDCTYLENGELCCEVLNGKNCYRCVFSQNLMNCADCLFCRDLIGCQDCLGCVNLRHKKYCWFNEQLSAEEYRSRLEALRLDCSNSISEVRERFERFSSEHPHKYYCGRQNEQCSGDYLENNKNAADCYNCRNSENISNCRDAWSGRNSVDLTETLDQDFCLELEGCNQTSNSGFSAKISETHDAWYCSHCFNSSSLFGCVGVKHGKHCILNKQYSPAEYSKLRAKIVAHMRNTGEWGEYFPLSGSPFAYNESVAQEYFPLSEEEAAAAGLRWKPVSPPAPAAQAVTLPDSLHDAGDEILERVLICPETGRQFKLQKSELGIYRKLGIALPRLHPDVRHQKRMNLRNPRRLHERTCSGCGASLLTTFAPERQVRLLCEKCYNSETM